MSNLSTLPKGDSAWLLRKAIERIIQQVSVLETNIGSSTTGNSANTQIIFNDNGTLRGDAGLVYNKTTDTLTAGAATITGDLTVRTTGLIVNTDGVGIGVTPTAGLSLTLNGEFGMLANNLFYWNGYYSGGFKARAAGYSGNIYLNSSGDFLISNTPASAAGPGSVASFYERYRINKNGEHTWEYVSNVAGTAMTLNSTGLGIGLSPSGGAAGSVYSAGSVLAAGGLTAHQTNRGVLGYSSNETTIRSYGATAGSGFITFRVAGGGASADTEAMRIDFSGNVGIGVVPSTAWNTGTNLQVGVQAALYSNSALGAVDLSSNSVRTGNDTYQYLLAGSNQASRFQQRDGAFRWFSATAGTSPNAITFGDAKMTLDANGYLLVGKTSVSPSNTGCELQTGTGGNAASVFVADGAFASIMNRLNSDGTIIDFRRQTSSVGYIAVTTLATTYNSISDYRLKEAVQPLVGGLARVSALKPSIYKWKVNGSDGEGFLAHELAEVVPSAVTGEKDAVNEDGSIKAQGVDMSRIVPILVAAIQELTAEVNALKNA